MRLFAKILDNVYNVNSWHYVNRAYLYEGQINEIYLQLVDLSKNIKIGAIVGSSSDYPLRYFSQASIVSLTVTFSSIDDTQIITAVATQPFIDDKSIWKITLPANQTPKSGSIQITITEDGVSKTFTLPNAITVELLNQGGC